MLEIGSIVDGKYKILNKIGQGGMSVVYLAMNEKANKQWAIKEVRKDGRQNYEVVRQGLIAETDILKRLNHPNLPSIIDIIDDGDSFLIVMDYIEGKPLSAALNQIGAQPQEFVVEWAKQLCDVLGYLHSRKPPIIYRDMKPSNVMLKPDGNVTLIDFGTAREFKSDRVEDTTCLGTRGYAAPEQFGGQGQTDARTDIYCLGATMYHLVTGHNPSKPPYEMRPIRQWNPNLSSGLEEIILKCTRPAPEDRYQSCAELMYALEHYTELDHEYRKKQKIKFGIFAASLAMTLVLGATSLCARAGENKLRNTTYENYLKKAELMDNDDEYKAMIENALELDPSRTDGIEQLLKHYLTDNTFEASEYGAIKTLINDCGEEIQTNKYDYAELNYDVGIAIWFNYENEGAGIQEEAADWFERVELVENENGETNSRHKNIADIYSTLGDDVAKLRRVTETGESEVTYGAFWNDLLELRDLAAGDPYMTLNVYKDIVSYIYSSSSSFRIDGVDGSEIDVFLTEVETYMSTVTKDSSNEDKVDYINANLSGARDAYRIAYGDTSTITSGEEAPNE